MPMVATTCRVIIPMKMIEVLSVELEILTPLMPHMIATLMFQQMPSYSGGQSARTLSGGLPGRSVDDPRMMGMGGVDPGAPVKDRVLGMGSGRPEAPLPPGATSTLFVEGLPPNCTRREVAHIFRPFVGYKEVRLVSKESRHPGGDPLVLCFVDFVSPAHAATAMDALQGYKFDEHDRDSVNLRLQFARYPGARSGGGHRGKR
ncbi:hypothetical protein PRUPE_2G315000 [Prunus persica]|uniref:RRM domain-containing protein n=1 Tax=Prunus persica TaxID=3760 RepID=A0A251QPF6_PRUPE|nr:hypothetical protein PRUPE_2G315000 [Prunus persica]